jgi:hypothetical protein
MLTSSNLGPRRSLACPAMHNGRCIAPLSPGSPVGVSLWKTWLSGHSVSDKQRCEPQQQRASDGGPLGAVRERPQPSAPANALGQRAEGSAHPRRTVRTRRSAVSPVELAYAHGLSRFPAQCRIPEYGWRTCARSSPLPPQTSVTETELPPCKPCATPRRSSRS